MGIFPPFSYPRISARGFGGSVASARYPGAASGLYGEVESQSGGRACVRELHGCDVYMSYSPSSDGMEVAGSNNDAFSGSVHRNGCMGFVL